MSRFLTRGAPALSVALAVLALGAPLQGQSWRDKLKKKVEQAADGAVDKAANGNGSGAATPAAGAPALARVNYDFVPGTRVLFAEDFSRDHVDDIPSRVKILDGNWQVVDFKGQRWLNTSTEGAIMIPLPGPLPEKFTFEADVIQPENHPIELWLVPDDARDSHEDAEFGPTAGIGKFKSDAPFPVEEALYHARLMVDGEHAKVYMNQTRVANVPTAKLGRANALWLKVAAYEGRPFYITNIRVAASDKSLFDALSADGRVATHGILFATGSDQIQPESTPTLQQIGEMLQAHPDLKLTIEGHTDNVGQSAANLTLSQKRAEAVARWLEAHYPIEHDRLQPKGFGDTKPVASNANEEGRQQNRRVELVKM